MLKVTLGPCREEGLRGRRLRVGIGLLRDRKEKKEKRGRQRRRGRTARA